jgi:hypothetical protein
VVEFKELDHKEGNRFQGGGSLGRRQQSSRKRINMKWMTKTKRRVVELKEDDHQKEGDKTQGGQPSRRGQHISRKMTLGKRQQS